MKTTIAVLAVFVLTCAVSALSAGPYDMLAAPAKEKEPTKPALNYWQGSAKAIADDRDLMIFVGIKSRPLHYAVSCETERMDGYPAKCIILASPNGRGGLYWVMTLSEHGDPIKSKESEVEPSAIPFAQSAQARPGEIVDDNFDAAVRGPWPNTVEFPSGMIRFLPAKFTQRLFNRYQMDVVPRAGSLLKWRVPGGMEGIRGWRSDLYELPNKKPRTWKDTIYVLNGFGDTQPETGYKRKFPIGSKFMDVLSNIRGEVFEIRVREVKLSDFEPFWDSSVLYENATARPSGYSGIRLKQCAECHNQAGTGSYNDGLVPGGDTVHSKGVEGIE